MKRTLFALLFTAMTFLAASMTASAQRISDFPESGLRYRNGNVYTQDGTKLKISTAMDYMPEQNFEYYRTGKELFNAGIWTSSFGVAAFVGGLVTVWLPPYNESFVPFMFKQILGSAILAAGGVLLLTSIPLYAVGVTKMKKSTREIPVTLSFVTNSGGVGLALNF